MSEPQAVSFLDVNTLLERSQPRPHQSWMGYGAGVFLLVVLLSAWVSMQGAKAAAAVQIISPLAMMGIVGVMMLLTWFAVQRRRGEMKQLEAVEELVQLRRWPEAALILQGLLSEPTRTPQARAQALIYLGSVLARYHRFDDAIAVQNHLLDHVQFDDGTDHGLRLGRAMAMLREDHLVDADRAISELRRSENSKESAGLALVEIYRDVKTGHPAEAIARFDESMTVMRDQLGHRCGDAYGLVARAYDLIGREAEAQQMYERATLLQPAVELTRRYPELAAVVSKYKAAETPAGVTV